MARMEKVSDGGSWEVADWGLVPDPLQAAVTARIDTRIAVRATQRRYAERG